MNQTIIIGLIIGTPTFGIAILTFIYTVKTNKSTAMERTFEKFNKQLDLKMNKITCNDAHERIERFKARIGKESDDHGKSIHKLEKGMIFVVDKLGGDSEKMGLLK